MQRFDLEAKNSSEDRSSTKHKPSNRHKRRRAEFSISCHSLTCTDALVGCPTITSRIYESAIALSNLHYLVVSWWTPNYESVYIEKEREREREREEGGKGERGGRRETQAQTLAKQLGACVCVRVSQCNLAAGERS